MNTLAGMDTPSETLRSGWREMEAAFEAGNLDEAVEVELRMWVDGPRRNRIVVDRTVRERVREMDFALLQRAEEQDAATELEPDIPLIDRLHELACPVLIVTGCARHARRPCQCDGAGSEDTGRRNPCVPQCRPPSEHGSAARNSRRSLREFLQQV